MTFVGVVDVVHQYVAYLSQLQTAVGQGDMPQQAHILQQFYRQSLWQILTQEELTKQQSQWRSTTTEIHRHMRLLVIDVSFAQSARHSHTRQQRLNQIEQRLEQLQGFAQVLITLVTDE